MFPTFIINLQSFSVNTDCLDEFDNLLEDYFYYSHNYIKKFQWVIVIHDKPLTVMDREKYLTVIDKIPVYYPTIEDFERIVVKRKIGFSSLEILKELYNIRIAQGDTDENPI